MIGLIADMQLLKIFDISNVFQLLLVTFVCLFTIWLVQFHWRRRRLYAMAKQVHGPTPLPIIGNALHFFGGSPEDLEIILTSPKSLGKAGAYNFVTPLLGNGLLTAPVPIWRRHRKIIAPTFNQKILDSFVPIFVERSTDIVEKQLNNFVGKGNFDVYDYVNNCTFEIICETAMGVRVNAEAEYANFGKWVARVTEIMALRIFKIWYQLDFIYNLFPISKEEKQLIKNINDVSLKVIREKQLAYKKFCEEQKLRPVVEESGRGKVFLDWLIELSENGVQFTDTELKDEVIIFMMAGSETTATINSYVLVMLGMYQDVQESVYEEILEVVGTERDLEVEDLPRLKYLERVIKETMRLFPIAPGVLRKIEEDIKLKTITLPAGSTAVVGLYYLHREEKYWPEPLKFNPDRFLPEEVAKRHPYSYLPFSGGPRNCIGMKYAMMAMKTLISTVVRKYRIYSDYKNVGDIKTDGRAILKIQGGFNISLKLRK